MVYNTELLGFRALSIVRYSKKLEITTFIKMDLFLSSGKGETLMEIGLRYLYGYSCTDMGCPVIEVSFF
jgi:hypothetical protein